MKKLLVFLLIFTFFITALASCDKLPFGKEKNNGTVTEETVDKNEETDNSLTADGKKIPVYKGMSVSRIQTLYAGADGNGNNGNDNGNHNGHFKGDHTGKGEEFDKENPYPDNSENENIEEEVKSSLVVEGADRELYYANSGEDVYINIHIENPDKFEILSFTLNGEKYSSYMFESGSTLETLILKYNVGDVGGIVEYTIDAIKYVEGTAINDVKIDGDKTVKVGVRNDDQITAEVSDVSVTTDTIGFKVNVTDTYNLVEYFGGSFKAVLYNGEGIVATKDVNKGTNSVSFDGLMTNTLYQYAIVACYDDLSGNGFGPYVITKSALYTEAVVLFDNITFDENTVSFTLAWNEKYEATLTAIKLLNEGNVVKTLALDATSVELPLVRKSYTIVAEYLYNSKSESIQILVSCRYAVPTIEITDFTHTNTNVSFGIKETDESEIGYIAKIELYRNGILFATADNADVRSFANLQSNSDYVLKVTYVYDLDEGDGPVTVEKTEAFTVGHDHVWAGQDCTSPAKCTICKEEGDGPLGHTGGTRNCQTELLTCERCGKLYPALDQYHYLDGTHENGLYVEDFAENAGYIMPEMVDGYYKLENTGDTQSEFQIWIDSEENMISGFSSKNNAAGFLSFKIKSAIGSNVEVYLYDSSVYSSGNRYSIGNLSCVITDCLFSISQYKNYLGEHILEIEGTEILLDSEDSATDWYEIKIGMVLNPTTDRIDTFFYLNGEYVKSGYLELSTVTNSINSVLFIGTIDAQGSVMLDDIIFGYSANESWEIEEHMHGDGVMVDYTASTCTEMGYETYLCGCGAEYKVEIDTELGHSGGTATCTSYAICDLCGKPYGKYSHDLVHTYENSMLTYSCKGCDSTFDLLNGYYLSGTGVTGIAGTQKNASYTVTDGTYSPKIVDGHYELLNQTGSTSQLELWVPHNSPAIHGFSAADNAVGFVSFKINSYTDNSNSPLRMQFVDTSSTGDRWSYEWCLTDPFFTIDDVFDVNGPVQPADGKYRVWGWDNLILKTFTITEADSFTGWFDVKIGIVLNGEDNTITLYYYIDGEYIGTRTKELTTSTKAINSFYITAYTTSIGCGVMLDDIAFGYQSDGHFIFDRQSHEIISSVVTNPTCTKGGYTTLTCSCGYTYVTDNTSKVNHIYENGVCKLCLGQAPSECLDYVSNGDGTCYVTYTGDGTETEIVIPAVSPDGDTVTEIGAWAFNSASNLTSIVIPNSVILIGNSAFNGCTKLTDVVIPDSVIIIGSSAFNCCTSLATVTMGNGVESILNAAFQSSGIRSIKMSENLSWIDDYAFHGCENLTEITIPKTVTSIGAQAFVGCSNLKTVIFENPKCWYYGKSTSNSAVSVWTDISESSLSDPANAAYCLTKTLGYCPWKIKE